ncbi:hypothetical protein C8Q77DRAFT_437328 [Trametes polyzona]|nr:hypothetical protein C8Q77DRAFT_437328 [Trametes polyzona]
MDDGDKARIWQCRALQSILPALKPIARLNARVLQRLRWPANFHHAERDACTTNTACGLVPAAHLTGSSMNIVCNVRVATTRMQSNTASPPDILRPSRWNAAYDKDIHVRPLRARLFPWDTSPSQKNCAVAIRTFHAEDRGVQRLVHDVIIRAQSGKSREVCLPHRPAFIAKSGGRKHVGHPGSIGELARPSTTDLLIRISASS